MSRRGSSSFGVAAAVGPRGTRSFGGALALAAGLLGACGASDGGEGCVETLCDAATFAPRCLGLGVMSCAQDGRSYVTTPCNPQERCDASSGTARCTVRACTRPGVSTCLNALERETCLPDGSGRVRESCPAGEGCRDGVCVPADCRGEADVCTTNGLLKCVDGAWQQTTCPSGEVCAMTGGIPSCGAPRCVPNGLRCEDRRVHACDGLGGSETETPCADGEICVEGVCRPPVCGETIAAADTAGGEVVAGAAEMRFNAGGTVQVLTLDAQASYTQVGRRLTLSARRGLQRFEIRLAPIAEVATGAWDSTVFNPTQITACWDDGTGEGEGVGDCEAPFTHAATTWQVAVTRNGGLGERVEGTFSFDMADINRDPLTIRDGSFSVFYR